MLRLPRGLSQPRRYGLLASAVLATALTATPAARASGLPLQLTCTASWTAQFNPGILLTTSQSGTVTVSDGTLSPCADTSGQGPSTIRSGTFTGSGPYTGICLTGTASLTLDFTWQLANGSTDHSVATASAAEATLAVLSQLTITSGRLDGDTITVADARTQENIGNCLTTGLTQVTATGVMLVTSPG